MAGKTFDSYEPIKHVFVVHSLLPLLLLLLWPSSFYSWSLQARYHKTSWVTRRIFCNLRLSSSLQQQSRFLVKRAQTDEQFDQSEIQLK